MQMTAMLLAQQVVDFPSWLSEHFTVKDYVVLKLDVEGAEHEILAKMLKLGQTKLIDQLGIECHGTHSCSKLLTSLSDAKVSYRIESERLRRKPGSGLATYMPTTNWTGVVARFWDDLRSPRCTSRLGSRLNHLKVPSA